MKKKKTWIDPLRSTTYVRVITTNGQSYPKFDSEKHFQKAVVAMFINHGWRVAVFNETGRRTWKHNIGWPDLIAVKGNQIHGLELKYKGNTRTPEQLVWGQVLTDAGVPTRAAYPDQWQELERLARGEE